MIKKHSINENRKASRVTTLTAKFGSQTRFAGNCVFCGKRKRASISRNPFCIWLPDLDSNQGPAD